MGKFIFQRFSKLRASLSKRRRGKYSPITHNIKRQHSEDTDEDGNNSLHIAARDGKYDRVKFFLEYVLDIHAQNKDGDDALMLATKHGHKKIVKKLLASGADVSVRNKRGENAYELAKINQRSDIARIIAVYTSNQRCSGSSINRFARHERYVAIREEQRGNNRNLTGDVADPEIKHAQDSLNSFLDESNRIDAFLPETLQLSESQEFQGASSQSSNTLQFRESLKAKDKSLIFPNVLQNTEVCKVIDASRHKECLCKQDSTSSAEFIETRVCISRKPSRKNDADDKEVHDKRHRNILRSQDIHSLPTENKLWKIISIRPSDTKQPSHFYDINPEFTTVPSPHTNSTGKFSLTGDTTRQSQPDPEPQPQHAPHKDEESYSGAGINSTEAVKRLSQACQTDPTLPGMQEYSTPDFQPTKRRITRSKSQTSSITLNFINFDKIEPKNPSTVGTDFNQAKMSIKSCPDLTINYKPSFKNKHYNVEATNVALERGTLNYGVQQETDTASEDMSLDSTNSFFSVL